MLDTRTPDATFLPIEVEVVNGFGGLFHVVEQFVDRYAFQPLCATFFQSIKKIAVA
jgi:hypothetical protein